MDLKNATTSSLKRHINHNGWVGGKAQWLEAWLVFYKKTHMAVHNSL